MTSERELRTRYDDILNEGDDATCVQIVADLESVYPTRRPPSALYAQLATSREAHATAPSEGTRIRLPRPSMGRRQRRRLSFAALVIAIGAIGMGTSGLAAAAIHTVQTHLFSNPPPSPQAAVWVGSMEIPMWGGCAPRTTAVPITAPDGRRFAQLDPVPSGLADSVSVVFTPCQPRPPSHRPVPTLPPSPYAWESIRTLSVVRYQGSEGALEVITGQATAEGMRRGLYLGNPAGTLADGSRAFDLVCSGGCAHRDNIRWLKDGLIVSISGDMSVDRLKEIAANVTLK